MKIRCQCGAVYEVPETTGGKKVLCRNCDAQFVCPFPSVPFRSKSSSLASTGKTQQKPRRRSSAGARARSEEDAILKSFMSEEKSLEQRMAERRTDSIEQDRVSNSFWYIFRGVIFFAAAVATAVGLFAADRYEYLPVIVILLLEVKAQYWLPVVLVLIGIWNTAIGVGSLMKVVDIESEEQLPTHFG